MQAGTGWNTVDEIHFIDHLGSYTDTADPRELLLHRYQIAIDRRVNWGRVDEHKVRYHLAQLRGITSHIANQKWGTVVA